MADYDYDNLGRVSKLTRDNGVATAYTYDVASQLTDLNHHQSGTLLASSHYGLDRLGRRLSHTREDGVAETYGYDAVSEVTTVDYGTGRQEALAYDPVGNRTTFTSGSTATSYDTNALNQYTRLVSTIGGKLSPVTPTYDRNGNLLDDGTNGYTYDAQNRLIEVISHASAPVRAEFIYDGRNRCVLRRYYTAGSQGQWVLNATDSRALTYDNNWNLLAERNLAGQQVGEYVHGSRTDEIIRAQLDGKLFYPLTDGLGSTAAVTDAAGNVVDRVRYDVYGTPRFLSATYKAKSSLKSGHRFLFTGREWLGQVGLNDHRNRYYSPGIGRWLSTDPIGFEGGHNLHAYVGSDPVDQNDPSGLLAAEQRDCKAEYTACLARGVFVVGTFKVCAKKLWVWDKALNGWTSDIAAGWAALGYKAACDSERSDCEAWNESHRLPNIP